MPWTPRRFHMGAVLGSRFLTFTVLDGTAFEPPQKLYSSASLQTEDEIQPSYKRWGRDMSTDCGSDDHFDPVI